MVTCVQHNNRFKCRVAGLCIHENYVLLTKADQDDYWILPGGRVELSEDTSTALQRELVEEIGHRAHVEDLLFIVENFFHLDGTNYHELAFRPKFLGPLLRDRPGTTQQIVVGVPRPDKADG